MAIYTDLPLYHAAYSLLLEVNKMMSHLPRDSRYSLGSDLRRSIMDIIILIYRANRNRQKVPLISQMREKLLEVQVYTRLLCDMRHISERLYAVLSEQTAGMSRQMSAWEKNERNRQSDGPSRLSE